MENPNPKDTVFSVRGGGGAVTGTTPPESKPVPRNKTKHLERKKSRFFWNKPKGAMRWATSRSIANSRARCLLSQRGDLYFSKKYLYPQTHQRHVRTQHLTHNLTRTLFSPTQFWKIEHHPKWKTQTMVKRTFMLKSWEVLSNQFSFHTLDREFSPRHIHHWFLF